MDYYLKQENSINRLVDEWKKYGNVIIAYDFDDTVYDFHKKGRNYNKVIKLLRRSKELGAYLIVFTANEDIQFVKKYLLENSIPFDLINENAPFVVFKSRKIYYNIFLDDRAGLPSSYKILLKTIKIIEKENLKRE